MEGLLRYLAETGRRRSGPLAAVTVEDGSGPAGPLRVDASAARRARERFLSALMGDRLVLCDASGTAGVEARLGGRIRGADLQRVARALSTSASGAASFEALSPATFATTLGLGESPLTRLHRLAAAVPELLFEATLDGTTGLGARPVAESVLREAAVELGRAGAGIIRVREAANRMDRLQAALTAAARTDALVEAVLVVQGDVSGARIDGMVEVLKKQAALGAALIGIEDPRGALRPMSAYALVRTLRRELPALPVRLRTIDTVGIGVATAAAAAEAGVAGVAVVQLPLAGGHTPPAASAIAYALGGTERAPALNDAALATLARAWKQTLVALAPWKVEGGEIDLAPTEAAARESNPPRPAAELDGMVRRRAEGEELQEAILEAHDPAAFQERKRLLERYGLVSSLPTALFLHGLRPGEEAVVALGNGGGEHRVTLRSLEQDKASFVVDGADLQVSVG